MTTRWSKEMIEHLTVGWQSGAAASEIAAGMCQKFDMVYISRNAVIGKAHRLGLAKGKRKVPQRPKRQAPKAPYVVRGGWKRGKPKPPSMPAEPEVEETHELIDEVKPGRCTYAFGDKLPYKFCGRRGHPYCDEHRALVYRPPPERKWRR